MSAGEHGFGFPPPHDPDKEIFGSMEELFPDAEPQTFESDVLALVKAAALVLRKMDRSDPLYERLSNAVSDVAEWGESDDPQQNGWVDSKGRP